MTLNPLLDMELRYTDLHVLDYGAGGQIFGTMEGTVTGERVRGSIRMVNLAPRRADNVNLPTLRGLVTTDDGAEVYIELTGIALLRPADKARVITAAVTFRTGAEPHAWLNTVFGVYEGVLDTVSAGGIARGRVYQCEPTFGLEE